MKRIISLILRISISIALLIFLFKKVDVQLEELIKIIYKINWRYLFVSFFIFLVTYILGLLRWDMLLRGVNLHLQLRRVIVSYLGGCFFNLFLPSSIGGDVVRSLDLSHHTKRPREVVATVLLDRLSGYTGLVLIALGALFFGFKFIKNYFIIFAILFLSIILIFIGLVLFNDKFFTKINRFLHRGGKIKEALKNLHREIYYFRHRGKRHRGSLLIDNLAISLIIQAGTPLIFFTLAKAINLEVNLSYFFIFTPIVTALSMLPISLGGLGIRDAATIFFLAQVNVGKNQALALSLINFIFILILGILGGIIYGLAIHSRWLQHYQKHARLGETNSEGWEG